MTAPWDDHDPLEPVLAAQVSAAALMEHAQQAGALGQIHVLMDHLHNMIVTTIWGTPSPETASRIPATPCLSILGADGERLRALMARAPLRLRMTTRVAVLGFDLVGDGLPDTLDPRLRGS